MSICCVLYELVFGFEQAAKNRKKEEENRKKEEENRKEKEKKERRQLVVAAHSLANHPKTAGRDSLKSDCITLLEKPGATIEEFKELQEKILTYEIIRLKNK